MTRFLLSALIVLLTLSASAQTSDSLIVQTLRSKKILFSDNNSVTLLMSGQEKFDDMFKAIRQAKSSVHLEYFNFRNDSIASLLFDILREKRKEGVEIRAMFDGFGNDSNNQPLKKHHLKALRDDSIKIVEYDPIRFPWVTKIFGRDHRKIVVIDGQIAYTGGMNVADYYIKGTEQVGEWRDMHCRIEGDAVNELQKIFMRIWNRVTGENVHGMKYYRGGTLTRFEGLKPDTTSTAGKKMVGIITREPHRTPKIMREFYVSAINQAQDSIKIINPYFTLIPKVTRALTRAIKRGVKVEIMQSAKSDIPLTPDCAYYQAHKLMKRGAIIWMYEPGFHHSKIMMVDGRYCTVGSTNLDARSLKCDFEQNAVIIDKETTKELDDMFDRDTKKSFLLTEESWNKFRTPWQKFRGWFAHLLAPFL
ncbi:MAG: cardiolipin synthase [Prevotella sp.]|nr:cardiolipin synthase [Prevotella sp.]MBQ8153882.1 cardiolipin synthase [Prevotella sp.]